MYIYVYMVYRAYDYHLGYVTGCLLGMGMKFPTQLLCRDYFVNH